MLKHHKPYETNVLGSSLIWIFVLIFSNVKNNNNYLIFKSWHVQIDVLALVQIDIFTNQLVVSPPETRHVNSRYFNKSIQVLLLKGISNRIWCKFGFTDDFSNPNYFLDVNGYFPRKVIYLVRGIDNCLGVVLKAVRLLWTISFRNNFLIFQLLQLFN